VAMAERATSRRKAEEGRTLLGVRCVTSPRSACNQGLYGTRRKRPLRRCGPDADNSGVQSRPLVQPSQSRIAVEERPDEAVMVLPTSRNWFVLAFIAAWLGGWAVGAVAAIGDLVGGDVEPFLIFWLAAWLVAGGAIFTFWLWNAFGREIIRLDQTALTLEQAVGPFSRKRRFDRTLVRDLRVTPDKFNTGKMSSFAGWGGLIAFDYGSRTYRFGAALEEAEAKQVVQELRGRLLPKPF
jgi:hypothetical protein